MGNLKIWKYSLQTRTVLRLANWNGASGHKMSKHKAPLLEALKEGKSYTWTVPEGGDLASMRVAIKHGQTLTMSPS